MGRRTTYPPGTFSWVELATPDGQGAKAFYGGLLGWQAEEQGDGSATFRLGGDVVAGLAPRAGGPAAWLSFTTVDDLDAAAARAAALGGAALTLPAVSDAARRAVLADPQGAAFGLWEPRGSIGAERVNDVGCLVMNELVSADVDAAVRFYGALFGWTADATGAGAGAGGPTMVLNDGRPNGALFAAPAGAAARWRPCFTVASVDETAKRIEELGGRLLLEPMTFPDGHGAIAVALDPQEAEFSVFAGEAEP